MPKRFISALIVFSLLFPDVARCGSFFGKEQPDTSEEEGERSHLTVQRRSIDSQDTPQAGQDLRINDDPTSPQWSPIQGAEGTRGGNPPKRHSTQIPQTQQGHQTEKAPLIPSGQPNQDSGAFPFLSQDFETVAQGLSLTEFIGGTLDGSDSDSIQIGNPSLLEEGGSGNAKSKKASKGQVPVDDDSKEEEGQEGAAPTPEEIAQINDYNQQSWKQLTDMQKGSLTGGELRAFSNPTDEAGTPKRASLYDSSSPLVTPEKNKELEDLILLPGNGAPSISPETEEFLRYVKVRVVDGKLNWKQILGIVGGVLLGIGVIYLLMQTIDMSLWSSKGLLEILGIPNSVAIFIFASMFGILPPVFDTASRTTSIYIEYGEDTKEPFCVQKSSQHKRTLALAKASLYFAALLAGFLPVLYFLNLSTRLHSSFDPFFFALPMMVLPVTVDIFLHYGHQLSHHATHWINNYFSPPLKEKSSLSVAEAKQQNYLKELKNLKWVIYEGEQNDMVPLYEGVFSKNVSHINNTETALHTLKALEAFYHQHINKFKPQDPQEWKKTAASWVGWSLALLATPVRHLVFWYAVDEAFAGFSGISETLLVSLGVILGGIIAGFIQGFIEKDAAEQTAYDILWGKKIPNGSSHYPLRVAIRIWDYFCGFTLSLPYFLVGVEVFNKLKWLSSWPLWARLLAFVPFGIADTLNNTVAFHDSNLNILNGFDSAMSYCYAFEGYKRDKLIRMTRQLRRLFKELRPEVLEEVDQMLKDPQRTLQRDDLKMISLDGDEV